MSTEIMTIKQSEQKIALALNAAQINVQKIYDAEKALVFNADGIQGITDFIKDAETAIKKVESVREAEKKPHLESGKNVDLGAKVYSVPLNDALTRVKAKWNTLAKQIAEDARIIREENERKQRIENGINNNILMFSTKILDCDSYQKVVELERLMNIERTQKAKYADFYDQFIERLDELKPKVSNLKLLYKEDSKLGEKMEEALVAGNDEEALKIDDTQADLKNKIADQQTAIAETASNSFRSSASFQTVVTAAPKARRTNKSWELVDIQKFAKAHPEMVEMVVKKDMVDELMKQKAKAKEFTEEKEIIVDGIKFYYEKIY